MKYYKTIFYKTYNTIIHYTVVIKSMKQKYLTILTNLKSTNNLTLHFIIIFFILKCYVSDCLKNTLAPDKL